MGLPDLHRFSLANNCNVPIGAFPRNVRLDLVIFLTVLHLRVKITVQRIPRALRPGASLRCGNTSQCC